MSQSVWDELVGVLHRPRLARFVDAAQREVVLELLRSVYVWFAKYPSKTLQLVLVQHTLCCMMNCRPQFSLIITPYCYPAVV